MAAHPSLPHLAITSTSAGCIVVVSTEDGREISSVRCGGPFPQGPAGVCYGANGALLVMVNGNLTCWHLAGQRLVQQLQPGQSVWGGYQQHMSIDGADRILLDIEQPSWVTTNGEVITTLADYASQDQ